MIYIFTILILFLLSIPATIAVLKHKYNNKSRIVMILFGLTFLVFSYFTYLVNKHINRASHLNAEIMIYSSNEVGKAKYQLARREYREIDDIMEQILRKYLPQAVIQDVVKGGLFNYSVGGTENSSFEGLGDIERGAGEKLANLNDLIEKKHQIAKELIKYKEESFTADTSKIEQELFVLKNSFFDGVVVSFFVKREHIERKHENKTRSKN